MKISEMITDRYKLRIPPTVYYELLADVVEIEEQEPCDKCEVGNPCLYCKHEFEPLEQEPRWIPVSKKLPEEYKQVLVSDSWCGVYVGQYVDAEENWGGEHFINEAGMHSKTVVAWMPLPKAYRGEEA